MVLIIGGSGYIGKNLCDYFSKNRKLTVGTYCNFPKKGLIHFDLTNPNIEKMKKNSEKDNYIIICSAISNIDFCKKNEKKVYKVNVEGTKKTLEQIFDLKKIPIFLSSDYVFNGKIGNYSERDKTNPCNVYGKHKKIIEDFILKSNGEFLIARISKIFGLEPNDNTLLTSWANQLKNNEEIYCAQDQRFSPTYIKDLANAINISIEKNLRGLYNIASQESFSRFGLANMVKEKLNIKTGKIIPCSIRDFNFLDSRPLNTCLNVNKFIQETRFKFSKVEDCINKLKES